ncbi:MAG: histidine kinase [Bacteroidales bacterium]|nr:histidine kinase [Bacteroidales bacterium]
MALNDRTARESLLKRVGKYFSSLPRLALEENLLYLVIWLVVGLTFSALGSFRSFLPFLLLFLLHNYVVFPLLFGKGNKAWYWISTALLLVLFSLYVLNGNLSAQRGGERVPADGSGRGNPPGMVEMDPSGRGRPAPHQMRRNGGDGMREGMDGRGDSSAVAPFIGGPESFPPGDGRFQDEKFRPGHSGGERRPEDVPPPPFGPGLMRIMMGILMIMTNLGSKMFFKSRENEQKMIELEKENLDQQLQYLRYQINPHFFMNTLNNIHALVDIDPEQAKSSILELSRMMRYILYEGDKPTIPLSKETEFLRHYIYLMRLRYSDSVKIDVDLPEECGNVEIPPMMFVSFVENAFKHGISYEKESFIRVSMSIENDKLIFRCANSRHGTNSDRSSGIGLANVRKRMDLLYGKDYTLHIDESSEIYDILAVIPVTRMGSAPLRDSSSDNRQSTV